MEHVPPNLRESVVSEALRVSRTVAVIGYPCGTAAFDVDFKLRESYLKWKLKPPVWLDEHMMHPFPDLDLFSAVPSGWKVKVIPNESLDFHYAMMRMEMLLLLDLSFRLVLYFIPGTVESLLRRADREPSYRTIFVLTRREPFANA
jgi:hypothetical protein